MATGPGLDWVIIRYRSMKIGAIGFVGNRAAVIASFFKPNDYNRDGEVSILERLTGLIGPINAEGLGVVEIVQAAKCHEGVYTRDETFELMANRMALHFFSQVVVEGAFSAWLYRSLRAVDASIPALAAGASVKQMIIRKGMKPVVKKIWHGLKPEPGDFPEYLQM